MVWLVIVTIIAWSNNASVVAVVQLLSPALCDPMNCSTPGFPVLHYLPALTQTNVHWVSDAVQPSHPAVIPFSSCLQSFPASGSFPVSRLFASGGQNIGASASASVLPMNVQGWFPLGWTRLISLKSQGLSRVFSSTTVQKSHTHSIKSMKSPHPQCCILLKAIPYFLHRINWESKWSLFS